jgi:hypothetical protein
MGLKVGQKCLVDEIVVAHLKTLYQYSIEGTEEYQEEPQSR